MINDHTKQPGLFTMPPRDFSRVQFGGDTYDEAQDGKRLRKHLQKVYDVMKSGEWITLEELAKVIGCSPQGASARIRDLTKTHIAGFEKEKRRTDKPGVWEYRLII